ncbi:hypothetical protein [Pseudarthrobacter sp. lyk4-40-TYG-27]|uniref:hypothetical protein n=1 Tax=Pseudarthrobacter sp. lyk4-40-TYG-27 TaxID=3040305 RepID=UPI00255338D6|nr:hypothetical protein [Pseudarthrobacter sp. lyk4-40-TYG-27]
MRKRLLLLLAVVIATLGAAGAQAFTAYQQSSASRQAAPDVQVASAGALPSGPFVLFRNTAPGQGFGEAATAALSEPNGRRTLLGKACDRVYAARNLVSCLETRNGMPTSFEASTYDGSLVQQGTWALGGIPNRTRVSADGSLVATTVFVSGHSYASSSFSTQTLIGPADGSSHSNLEDYALMDHGARIKATDRNIWGVTFSPGKPNEFYATASSQGNIWLVHGDIAARTLTIAASGVECPSVSPDGQRIAFKKSTSGTLAGARQPAVLELATGNVTVLGEQRDLDDQIEWLDNGTILYGMPREGAGPDSDIWSLSLEPGAAPRLFIEHAWSPAVVR